LTKIKYNSKFQYIHIDLDKDFHLTDRGSLDLLSLFVRNQCEKAGERRYAWTKLWEMVE
jgi:hypothetical protein